MVTAKYVAVPFLLVALTLAGCGRRQPPAAQPTPGPSAPPAATAAPPAPPTQRIADDQPVAREPLVEDTIGTRSLDDLNRDSPLQPVFFQLDGAELDDKARQIAQSNADLLKKYPGWSITIEGHCDERGTAEYNLALGERRAVSVKAYLVSLGISPDRVRTVSYGKEFPFDSGHNEEAWARNRRAHFVITSK